MRPQSIVFTHLPQPYDVIVTMIRMVLVFAYVQVCDHVPVICSSCHRGGMLRNELFQHQQVECDYRWLSCWDCGQIDIRARDMLVHRSECPKQV